MAILEFTDMTPEGKRFMRQLKELAELEVCVGFQAGDGTYEDGTTVAEVAAYNELGSSTTPARPFMKQSFENHTSELQKACDDVNNTLAKGGTAQKALSRLGTLAKGLIQEEIVEGGFAPNAESTVKQKGSAQPLIDSGLMRESVNFVVRKRK